MNNSSMILSAIPFAIYPFIIKNDRHQVSAIQKFLQFHLFKNNTPFKQGFKKSKRVIVHVLSLCQKDPTNHIDPFMISIPKDVQTLGEFIKRVIVVIANQVCESTVFKQQFYSSLMSQKKRIKQKGLYCQIEKNVQFSSLINSNTQNNSSNIHLCFQERNISLPEISQSLKEELISALKVISISFNNKLGHAVQYSTEKDNEHIHFFDLQEIQITFKPLSQLPSSSLTIPLQYHECLPINFENNLEGYYKEKNNQSQYTIQDTNLNQKEIKLEQLIQSQGQNNIPNAQTSDLAKDESIILENQNYNFSYQTKLESQCIIEEPCSPRFKDESLLQDEISIESLTYPILNQEKNHYQYLNDHSPKLSTPQNNEGNSFTDTSSFDLPKQNFKISPLIKFHSTPELAENSSISHNMGYEDFFLNISQFLPLKEENSENIHILNLKNENQGQYIQEDFLGSDSESIACSLSKIKVSSSSIALKDRFIQRLYKNKKQINQERIQKLKQIKQSEQKRSQDIVQGFEVQEIIQEGKNFLSREFNTGINQKRQCPFNESYDYNNEQMPKLNPKIKRQIKRQQLLRELDGSLLMDNPDDMEEKIRRKREEFEYLCKLLFFYSKSKNYSSRLFEQIIDDIKNQLDTKWILSREEIYSLFYDILKIFPFWIWLEQSSYGVLVRFSNNVSFKEIDSLLKNY